MKSLRLLAVLLSLACLQVAEAGLYREGEKVEFTGKVTDVEGSAIPDLQVVLEISRKAFTFKKMRKTRQGIRELAAVTDAQGQYLFEWSWQDYYNDFRLLVGVPTREEDGEEDFLPLEQVDLSSRVLDGSPVMSKVVVRNSRFLGTVRDFLSGLDSEDESRIYEEMGRPDRVQTLEYPTYDEVTWWYFREGKAYRFLDGELEQVVHFDPITPFKSY